MVEMLLFCVLSFLPNLCRNKSLNFLAVKWFVKGYSVGKLKPGRDTVSAKTE